MDTQYLRTEGLPLPTEHPLAEDITEADRRLGTLQRMLKRDQLLSAREEWETLPHVSNALSNNEYDLQYSYLLFLGVHHVQAVKNTVEALRVNETKNSGTIPSSDQVTAVGEVWRFCTEELMSGRPLALINRMVVDDPGMTAGVLESLKHGVYEPTEIREFITHLNSHPGSLRDGVL